MIKFIKSQPVLVVAFFAAVVTMFIIPPDAGYAGYVNRAVLIQLFSLMTAVAGLRSIGIFERVTDVLLEKAGTVRRLGQIFVLICFFTSMLVTNDVALLTFIPLTLIAMNGVDKKSIIMTIVLETAAANLGSMMTPVGNPQNLFIYANYHMTALTFVKTMAPAGIASLVILMLLTLLLPKDKCTHTDSTETDDFPAVHLWGYLALFAVCLLSVFRVIPDYICLISAVVCALILNRKLLIKVDYSLLATFLCFFVFVGNIARVGAVNNFFSDIMKGRELLVSAALSQVISNVPAAMMLSGFTDNGTQLMLGVNIGGLGTLIASLASLISFQFYRKSEGADSVRYIVVFSVVNFGMLIILLLLQMLIAFI
ncbi:SLC13 family permease [Ruminococcus albus]|uniref:Na+/H+ antiporter NhaD n=1 Tax=Ruminococcus albus TaxID=1264 RepID=A0A1I1RQ28_RUMAL|nr:SLC13 family permease [Ruminococcus albus]SFD36097.1 Na+/H+ antiporter NhaD [Ruminococcus albus]